MTPRDPFALNGSFDKLLAYYAIGLCLARGLRVGHAKNLSNQRQHGLSFAEVQGLFQGEVDVLEIFDAEHSDSEDRFIAIGAIDCGLVVVVYTEPEEDVVRIIGARFTKGERTMYRSPMDRFQ